MSEMESKEEIILQLRIDVEVLKVQAENAQEALKLARSNTLAWVMASVAVTSAIAVLLTFVFKGWV